MRFSRWIDHIPCWLAFLAVAATDLYEPWELAVMAAPLGAAAWVEWRQWNLGTWRRAMEILTFLGVLALFWARIGLIPTVIITLFLLCGVRLSLPRALPQRRQLLFMGFLIWITTAIGTFDIQFLGWSVLWVAGAGVVLMQQAWETSASLRGGPLLRAPYARIPFWTLATFSLSIGFFLIMPRLTLGLRAFPWGVAGLTSFQAGMSDSLDLGSAGPISPNSQVVLRILPPAGLPPETWGRYDRALALLRGVVLESVENQRWSPLTETPAPAHASLDPALIPASPQAGALPLELFVAPSPQGILPLPYGGLGLAPPPGMPIRQGSGGSLRWMYPSRRPIPLRLLFAPSGPREAPPSRRRIQLLTGTGQGTESAERWSRQVVPEDTSPSELARRLTDRLRTFSYTVSNPSGTAGNPLQDFLERTRAGHCEYFASALALMLRHRGVPARVVNGYRLGPWIDEGGYWLVTQNEAHSWVEYFDSGQGRWEVADPTPPAPPSEIASGTLLASYRRWMDAVRYRWDRHVVRFSDADQMAGFEWMSSRLSGWRPDPKAWLGGLAALVLGCYWVYARSRRSVVLEPESPYAIRALRPLLRAVDTPPRKAETARQWLLRLATLAGERAEPLESLAKELDSVAYGGGNPRQLRWMVKAQAKAWRKRRD